MDAVCSRFTPVNDNGHTLKLRLRHLEDPMKAFKRVLEHTFSQSPLKYLIVQHIQFKVASGGHIEQIVAERLEGRA